MKHALRLGIVLAALWLLLSGYFDKPLILAFGVISVALTVYVTHRMKILDADTLPLWYAARAYMYWPWLGVQIVKSNIRVAQIILTRGEMPYSPTLAVVPSSQKTALGAVIFANSITLTPGTVSIDVGGDGILVHALEQAGIDDLREGEMNRRVSAFEGLSSETIAEENTPPAAEAAADQKKDKA
ncbi:MAG: Na+/H+ antiporter subunit E [Rhodospirillaceae bacterium]